MAVVEAFTLLAVEESAAQRSAEVGCGCHIEGILVSLVENKCDWGGGANSQKIIYKVIQLASIEWAELSDEDCVRCEKALLFAGFMRISKSLGDYLLPDCILEKAVASYFRALDDIAINVPGRRFELLTKYLRVAFGVTLPNGAQVLDMGSSIPFYSFFLSAVREKSAKPLISCVSMKGWGRWFRMHTNSEYLDEFNVSGWGSFYNRTAELLRNHPSVRGVVGTSWFFDPMIAEISPRLAYLSEIPLSGGAHRLMGSSARLDVERATQTSPTRKKLYDQGLYNPRSFTIAWGRESLINWASES